MKAPLALLLFSSVAACGGSSMVRAAHDGDRVALLGAVEAEHVRGTLTLGEAAEVAHAVVAHEILAAKSPEEAALRVREVRGCSFALDDVLAERMKVDDLAGAEAALERLEAGAIGAGAARDHAASPDDRWRAVAVSGMTGADDHDARLRGLVDGSPLVRRAALEAIAERDDGTDVLAVLEAARLDPDALVRGAAVRILPRLHGAPADLALRLRDLWTSGDDALRGDVATALASRSLLHRGGLEALAHYQATSQGNDAVTVAGAILDAEVPDAPLRAAATAQLLAAIKGGGHRARIHAIAVVPLGSGWGERPPDETAAFADALKEASRAEELDVRLAALGRLSSSRDPSLAADRAGAILALEDMASPDDPTELRGSRARLLLAEAGDLRVQAWIEADLRAEDPEARLTAAHALAALGRASRAAPLLADDDASIRTRAACTILVASRLR